METSGSNAPAPMEGHGAYNRSSRVQAAGLAAAVPLFRQAAATVSLASSPEPNRNRRLWRIGRPQFTNTSQ
jgi:hypothetical protein